MGTSWLSQACLLGLSVAKLFGGEDQAVSARRCASCHPQQVEAYAKTRMASAMLPALQSAFADGVDKLALHEQGDGYQFVYKKKADHLEVVSFRGTDSAVGIIDWVLGSGAQGQTPIVRTGSAFLESRVSFFPMLHRYGITVGQNADASISAAASLGRSKTQGELSQCLGCHSKVLDVTATRVLPGVQCEQCHPGSDHHALGKGMPLNPGKLDSSQQVRLCGNCHRVTPPVGDRELENVRFQPFRLMKSQCFQVGNLACTSCHPAHQDALRNAAAFYDAKCLACHTAPKVRLHAPANSSCISCHMPRIQLHPALRFTDHFIRVVRTGDYPPGSIVKREQEAGNSKNPSDTVSTGR